MGAASGECVGAQQHGRYTGTGPGELGVGERFGDDARRQHIVEGQQLAEGGTWIERRMLARLDGHHGEGLPSGLVTRHVLARRGSKTLEPRGRPRQRRRRALRAQHQYAFGLPQLDGLAGLEQQGAAVRLGLRQAAQRHGAEPGPPESTLQGPVIHQASGGEDGSDIPRGQSGVRQCLPGRRADQVGRVGA
ncbi:hypothetical protein D3C85_876610 [compost metagenome]